VLDSAGPTKLLDLCVPKVVRNFPHMRYSAASGDPDNFKDNGSTLYQVRCGSPRRTELSIIMSMYKEANNLFTIIMHGVMKSLPIW